MGGHRQRDEKGKGQRFDSEHSAITGDGHFLSTDVGAKHLRNPKTKPQGSVCLHLAGGTRGPLTSFNTVNDLQRGDPQGGQWLLPGPSESL